uniref:Uncharacterized protein n=1 Tax=Anguilla anguilla TaxID=7936 RepID=A0A0E9QRT9_ANGAN
MKGETALNNQIYLPHDSSIS